MQSKKNKNNTFMAKMFVDGEIKLLNAFSDLQTYEMKGQKIPELRLKFNVIPFCSVNGFGGG